MSVSPGSIGDILHLWRVFRVRFDVAQIPEVASDCFVRGEVGECVACRASNAGPGRGQVKVEEPILAPT